MTIWVYSFVSHPKRPGASPSFDIAVTRKHPLLQLKEWREDERINDQPTILWYRRLDEHDWYGGDLKEQDGDPLAIQHYVDHALNENMGEL